MTTEEAIYALRIEGINLEGKVPRVCKFLEALDIAISALRAQQQPNDTLTGWISVKERLPDLDGRYLLYGRDLFDKHKKFAIDTSKVYSDGKSVGWNIPWIEVTHWMPLPKPPEEGTT